MSTVTKGGVATVVVGALPSVGQAAPALKLAGVDLSDKTLADFAGKKKVLNIVPSLDTGVCLTSAKKFNEKIAALPNCVLLNISADLPFAAKRACTDNSLANVVALSSFRNHEFAKAWGVEIASGPLTGLTARSVFVLDERDHIVYRELVAELSSEPNYAAALAAATGVAPLKVTVLGSGVVGQALATGFVKFGHTVKMASSRDPSKLADFLAKNPSVTAVDSKAAVSWCDVVVFAVKGTIALSLIKEHATELAGKVVLDATNPIADAPPVNGILQYFTTPSESLMEQLQAAAPAAKFVKAFSCVGNGQFVQPTYSGGRVPTMFICGNDGDAKKLATQVLTQFGWKTQDFGSVTSARAIEPVAQLWCSLGFQNNEWTHAFDLLHK